MDASPTEQKLARSLDHGTRRLIWIVAGLLTVLVPFGVRTALVNDYKNKAPERAAAAYKEFYRAQGKQYYDTNKCETKNSQRWKWWGEDCTPHYVDENGKYVSPYDMQQAMWEEQNEAMAQQYEYQQQQYEQNQQQMQDGNYYGQQGAQAQYNYQNQQYVNGNYPQYGTQGINTSVKDDAPWLKALYSLQVVAFVCILAHGWKVLSSSKDSSRLSDFLVAFLAFAFVTIVWIRALTIETEDWDTQYTGYYGQFSVLMFMTNIAYVVFALPAAYYFRKVYVSEEPPQADESDYVEAPAAQQVV